MVSSLWPMTKYLEIWLKRDVLPRVSAAVFERHRVATRQYLSPNFGHLRLGQLTARHISNYYAETLANRSRGRFRRFAAASLRSTHQSLTVALDYAVTLCAIKSNPCRSVPRPPLGAYRGGILSAADRRRLIKGAEGTPIFVPIILALTTGLYRNEILGLRWRDVDFAKRRISVAQVLRGNDQVLGFKVRNSHGALRVIPLPLRTARVLRAHQRDQGETQALLGPAYKDLGIVCARQIGIPMHSQHITTGFNKLRDRLGIDVRFTDLRHSYLAGLLAGGVRAKDVCALAGHSTIHVTRRIYNEFVRTDDRGLRAR